MRHSCIIMALVFLAGTFIPPRNATAQLHTADQATWYLTLNHYNPHKSLGYVTIPVVDASRKGGGGSGSFRNGDGYTLEGLSEGFRRMTSMDVYHGGLLPLNSPSLDRYPVIAVATNGADPTNREIGRLADYIASGGFVILGEGNPKRQKALFGRGVAIRRVPIDHPLYDCFFSRGELNLNGSLGMTGIWKGGRLVGISSDVLFRQWSGPYRMIPETGMKQSVNIIVYGLMQGLE